MFLLTVAFTVNRVCVCIVRIVNTLQFIPLTSVLVLCMLGAYERTNNSRPKVSIVLCDQLTNCSSPTTARDIA